jgi:hypothetical protein
MKRTPILIALGGLTLLSLTACSHATPSISQCAIVTGRGVGDNQTIKTVVYPGQKIGKGSSEQTWYIPCNARNYVTGEKDGDQTEPLTVKVGGGKPGDPGMPVNVSLAVYWQLNQSKDVMQKFFTFCFKYGCASQDSQQDSSNQDLLHSSTPGWNAMLKENFPLALNRAALDVAATFPSNLWQDQSQWQAFGKAVAAKFQDEMKEQTGDVRINNVPVNYFCGPGSDTGKSSRAATGCTPVQISVQKIAPSDPQIVTQYNQQVAAQNAQAVNQATLKAAQAKYGPYASYFLGLQDTIDKCNAKPGCTIVIGNPGTLPTK